MTTTHYVALLRGINVGGRNLIRMADLRSCFEGAGFGDVATYIQSGNVLFTAAGDDGLTARIEDLLASTFDYGAAVALRTREEMRDVVGRAPEGFGAEPDRYRYDVIFLRTALTARAALESVPTKPGVDQALAGDGVLYFARLISKATQSRLSRITSLPIYRDMTIRNWNTTTKLLALMEARE
jgi:uncharacterized protein (DUF1697 family)